MNTIKNYNEKYLKAKELYLSGYSLTFICKELHMDRGSLSKNLKADNIEIINKQNLAKFNENFFDIIDNSHKAYWLGFMYADGYVATSTNNIELSLKSSDIKHLNKFIKDLNFNNKQLFQDNIRCRLTFRNKHLKESLIKLGCTPQKSLTLTFPSEEQVPNIFLYDFLRGYIDGDGSIMIGKDSYGLYTKPRLNILGTKNFLESLIQKTSWRATAISQKTDNQVYGVEWSGKYVMNYLNQLYQNADIYLDRKYEKYLTLYQLNNCRSEMKVSEL